MFSINKVQEYTNFFLAKNHNKSFEYIRGNGRIIVSAPHSVEQTREGEIKFGEYQTGVLAKVVNDIIGCSVFYKTHNYNDDANYDEICEYKDALIDFVKSNNICCLIDLHQMAPWREEMIDIGTGKGANIFSHNDILAIIEDSFRDNNISTISVDYPFDAVYPYTVSATIARTCLIPCFQIEINSRLLCNEYREYSFDLVKDSLIAIIGKIEQII